jgi:hypothetical protein
MHSAGDFKVTEPVGEMAIVDTFTKLIFGEVDAFSSSEELIIQAFRRVDHSVVLDSHRDMGIYLRALGVAEMIQQVTRVQTCMVDGVQALARVRKETILDRRAH